MAGMISGDTNVSRVAGGRRINTRERELGSAVLAFLLDRRSAGAYGSARARGSQGVAFIRRRSCRTTGSGRCRAVSGDGAAEKDEAGAGDAELGYAQPTTGLARSPRVWPAVLMVALIWG
jgi:hypothetical protein